MLLIDRSRLQYHISSEVDNNPQHMTLVWLPTQKRRHNYGKLRIKGQDIKLKHSIYIQYSLPF